MIRKKFDIYLDGVTNGALLAMIFETLINRELSLFYTIFYIVFFALILLGVIVRARRLKKEGDQPAEDLTRKTSVDYVMRAIQRLEELGAKRKICRGRPPNSIPCDAELPDLIGKDGRCTCETYNGDNLNCPAHYGTSAESHNE